MIEDRSREKFSLQNISENLHYLKDDHFIICVVKVSYIHFLFIFFLLASKLH